MKMSESKLRGVITALITPFKKGELDIKSFTRLLRHQMDQGIRGFVINGTTGESPTLAPSEVQELYEVARVEVGGAAALIVGTGSNSTATAIELSKRAAGWGPQALLSVVPYYNKPPQRGLESHFKAVADSVEVPIILYNVPSRTVANLEPESVNALAKHPRIVGIKDATGDMNSLRALQSQVDRNFILLSGDDASCVDFVAAGGHGVISVSSHIIGAEMIQATNHFISEGESYKQKYADLMRLLYVEANPIPVKAALYWMGVIDSPELRLPLMALDPKFHKDFQSCLKNLGKL